MKTTIPINISSRLRPCRGLTILEMLVSVALLSFIILGLTAMFVQTQKAFKTGLKQSNVTDAGRSVIDMIAADLSQLSDPHFTNVEYPPPPIFTYGTSPASYAPPTLFWQLVPGYQLFQTFTNTDNGFVITRTNEVEDIYAMVQTNATWLGIGYAVSNWFTNSGGGAIPGVGTLYRFVLGTNGPIATNNNIYWPLSGYSLWSTYSNYVNAGTFTNALFHRVADGIVHLKIYAFDASGNEMPWEPAYDALQTTTLPYLQYPTIEYNPVNANGYPLVTNYLPYSIDIELGVLEPEALEHARTLFASGATAAAQTYLAGAVNQVQIFRQHIIIPSATQ